VVGAPNPVTTAREGGGEANSGGVAWRLGGEGLRHNIDTLRAGGEGADRRGEEAGEVGDGGAKGGGGSGGGHGGDRRAMVDISETKGP
jgi:hypothetical protein